MADMNTEKTKDIGAQITEKKDTDPGITGRMPDKRESDFRGDFLRRNKMFTLPGKEGLWVEANRDGDLVYRVKRVLGPLPTNEKTREIERDGTHKPDSPLNLPKELTLKGPEPRLNPGDVHRMSPQPDDSLVFRHRVPGSRNKGK